MLVFLVSCLFNYQLEMKPIFVLFASRTLTGCAITIYLYFLFLITKRQWQCHKHFAQDWKKMEASTSYLNCSYYSLIIHWWVPNIKRSSIFFYFVTLRSKHILFTKACCKDAHLYEALVFPWWRNDNYHRMERPLTSIDLMLERFRFEVILN